MKNVYRDKELCSGCNACAEICKFNAISMLKDEEGFFYPQINKEKCINCNACRNICPINRLEKNSIIKTFGVKHRDNKELTTSRSGGGFIAIANYMLKSNAAIYGVIMTKEFKAKHERAIDKEGIDKFKGSKYIQSNMNDIIKRIQKDLKEKRQVLFSGTPCQVAGVKSIIKDKNLITCDLICHAAPSPLVLDKYLAYIEKKENKKIKEVNLRDKKYGWSPHYETITFEDGSIYTADYFKELFYKHYSIRPSCYNCYFKTKERVSDITLADFWGINKIDESFYDEKGVSLLLINSKTGLEIFDKIKDELYYKEYEVDDAAIYNPALYKGHEIPEDREKFWEDLINIEFIEILNKYTKGNVIKKEA